MAEPIVNDFRAIHARMQQIRAERSSPPSRGRCAVCNGRGLIYSQRSSAVSVCAFCDNPYNPPKIGLDRG
jgi:excinuclease UvrABC ATPase subunit